MILIRRQLPWARGSFSKPFFPSRSLPLLKDLHSRLFRQHTKNLTSVQCELNQFILVYYTRSLTWITDLDPYTYTSGRWLRHDKLERDLRISNSTLNALCQRVIDLSPGAESITACEKKEGGFNRVFVFTLESDNANKRVMARIPFGIAGPAQLTTAS